VQCRRLKIRRFEAENSERLPGMPYWLQRPIFDCAAHHASSGQKPLARVWLGITVNLSGTTGLRYLVQHRLDRGPEAEPHKLRMCVVLLIPTIATPPPVFDRQCDVRLLGG